MLMIFLHNVLSCFKWWVHNFDSTESVPHLNDSIIQGDFWVDVTTSRIDNSNHFEYFCIIIVEPFVFLTNNEAIANIENLKLKISNLQIVNSKNVLGKCFLFFADLWIVFCSDFDNLIIVFLKLKDGVTIINVYIFDSFFTRKVIQGWKQEGISLVFSHYFFSNFFSRSRSAKI